MVCAEADTGTQRQEYRSRHAAYGPWENSNLIPVGHKRCEVGGDTGK